MQDENELYELDKHTATAYVFVTAVRESTGKPVTYVACQRHTEPAALPFRARALANMTPRSAAVVANVWDVLEFIEQHEHEHHGGPAAPVPYLPADTTAVLPIVASAGNRPPASAIHGASTNGSIPPGTDWTALAGVGLDVRHRSGRAVPVHRVDYTDGSQVFTLPADGFPGATWEIRASAPYVAPAPFRATGHVTSIDPLTCGHPVPDRWISTECVICRTYLRLSGMEPPATGSARPAYLDRAADACGRCGADVRKDPAQMVLPPPLGSLSAAHPMTLCGPCNDGIVALVAAYVSSPPAAPEPGTLENLSERGAYCRHCDVFTGYGAAGVVKPPEGKSPEWLAVHCWMCKRSAAEISAGVRG
jgi:hypothetical protein